VIVEVGFWGESGNHGDPELALGSHGGGVGVHAERCGRLACQSWYDSAQFFGALFRVWGSEGFFYVNKLFGENTNPHDNQIRTGVGFVKFVGVVFFSSSLVVDDFIFWVVEEVLWQNWTGDNFVLAGVWRHGCKVGEIHSKGSAFGED
jgi:hypothetical protein